MNEPTEEQIKRFWERCELEEEWEKWTGIKHIYWTDENGDKISDSEEPPPIDLNNLFKYAVPKLVELGYEVILFTYQNFYEVEINDNEIPARKQSYGAQHLSPALALFWAIYKVMEDK